MNLFLVNLLLALAWVALTGSFQPVDLLFGFLLGYGVLWLAFRSTRSKRYFSRFPKVVEFVLFFVKELLLANLRMAVTILSPKMQLRPGVVAVPLDLKTRAGIVFLANMITLTPGTLSLDISVDRKMLYVHTVWLEDAEKFRSAIKQEYERRVKEIVEA
ncbi:MAG: Na+/H+ antiporter subunit E [Anaerolineae bacterium]|nr:Na+/H+ antiporter subunit E [Anaerolineae bacterium]